MKLTLCVLVILPMFSISQQSYTVGSKEYDKPGIQWTDGLSWDEIKMKAKAENKYIFMDCYTTWCVWCRKMDKEVFSDPQIVFYMGNIISVKVQMDSSIKDNIYVKSWYANAHNLMKVNNINSFPSFLFFSPDGKIVHKDGGFKDLKSFVLMTRKALDPNKELNYVLLANYRQGKKHYKTMGSLAIFTSDMIGDRELAYKIAKDYKENHLNVIDSALACTKENLFFISKFPLLLNTKDLLFQFCYHNPENAKLLNTQVDVSFLINLTITREEIDSKLMVNGKAIPKRPNWKMIEANVRHNYKKIDARQLLLDYKLKYYRSVQIDWRKWAKYKEKRIKNYPPKPPYGLSVYTELNGWDGAWLAFIKCNDRKVLKKAVEWVDMAIQLEGIKYQYLDTKANLLYKLGKRKHAIELQRRALSLAPNNKDITEAFEKMKKNEPTYLHEGAVWKKIRRGIQN